MNGDLRELRRRISEAEIRFDKMRRLVDETGYDWDMIELKRMQRELDDLIKRYEERVTKKVGRAYRYSSGDVLPQIGTHAFGRPSAGEDVERGQ
jgi:hypothetical protein